MKNTIAIILSLFLLLPQGYSQPVNNQQVQTEFKIDTAEPMFEPAPFNVRLGELDFTAFYMMPDVISPIYGVLVDKDTFGKIEFVVNQQDSWCQLRVDKERELCDKKLKESADACKDLNKDLIEDKLELEEKVKELKLEVKDERFFSKTLMWIGGTAITLLSGTLIYVSASK